MAAVRAKRVAYTKKVNVQAVRVPGKCQIFMLFYNLQCFGAYVPEGMDFAGLFNSPERFAPAMMPVTPAKRTENVPERLTETSESSQSNNGSGRRLDKSRDQI